ncbi:hypothetical protein V6N11_018974 [Hibiscus sabdariffa]|uniref:Uncharacterized protein n=1 Tax=Hibiscus sabdariffa TaxID=183260 RepID=A0ABR2R1J1_9ROSI
MLTSIKDTKVFDEYLPKTVDAEYNLLKDYSSKGLLEFPQDKALTFKGCGELTWDKTELLLIQGVLLDSVVVAREVESDSSQVFIGTFVRKCKAPAPSNSICKLVENDDPYGFRLSLMAKDNKAGDAFYVTSLSKGIIEGAVFPFTHKNLLRN